ncbi:MAG: hypothetical protein WCN21_12115 [Comamonadaceae bacterium]
MRTKNLIAITASSAAVILVACGGGSSSTSSTTPTVATTISGSAVKGPVSGATVTVKNAGTGAVLGTTTTGAGGTYSLSVPYSGDVIVEVSGGTYTDEATNQSTTLTTPLKVVITANGSAVTGVVTPLTTMAYTYAFGSTGTPTAAAFNTMASSVATQFKLTGVNLATTVPTVSGTMNDYGKVLAAVSKYLQTNSVTLSSMIGSAWTADQWSQFSGKFTTAYSAANPGSTISYTFDGSTLGVSGTGVGGGTGSCGVNVKGTISTAGISVPLNLDYCITGVATGSCSSGNASLSQALSGQSGMVGAVNLAYTYSAACVANPLVTIALH